MSIIPEKPNSILNIFGKSKSLIGTVHCLPFPGAPRYQNEDVQQIVEHAISESCKYEKGGI